MMVIISPAKTIDFALPFATQMATTPTFAKETRELVAHMQTLTAGDLSSLMHISEALGELNFERFQNWNKRNTPKKQALGLFKGEVYNGMQAWEWSEEELLYAQHHLRIVSGLYGVLKPLDAIKAYRLEMGTRLEFGSLYEFWGDKITRVLNRERSKSGNVLVNLASNEYNKAVDFNAYKGTVITPEFKDLHQGAYKMIGVYAKKARGLMARFIVKNKIENAQELKTFAEEGYVFNTRMSNESTFVFTRG